MERIELHAKTKYNMENDSTIDIKDLVLISRYVAGYVDEELVEIINGDVNGDGSINAIDLLAVRKEIMNPGTLTDLYKKAANVDKNEAGINAVDLLMIRKHILKEYTIEQ